VGLHTKGEVLWQECNHGWGELRILRDRHACSAYLGWAKASYAPIIVRFIVRWTNAKLGGRAQAMLFRPLKHCASAPDG